MGRKIHYLTSLEEQKPTDHLLDSVASIYFSNGSNIIVVKMEGSPAYKHLMRTAEANK